MLSKRFRVQSVLRLAQLHGQINEEHKKQSGKSQCMEQMLRISVLMLCLTLQSLAHPESTLNAYNCLHEDRVAFKSAMQNYFFSQIARKQIRYALMKPCLLELCQLSCSLVGKPCAHS